MGLWLTLHQEWGSEDICLQAVVYLIEIKSQPDSLELIFYEKTVLASILQCHVYITTWGRAYSAY